jgi:hypothetical protein
MVDGRPFNGGWWMVAVFHQCVFPCVSAVSLCVVCVILCVCRDDELTNDQMTCHERQRVTGTVPRPPSVT